ncbi:MAG: DMT family transporter, partial [Bacteroidales bacterium]|nr:DMT family transporter [Bacteroidales bacterium]
MRFVLAYVAMLPFAIRKVRFTGWKDELMFAVLGLTGGSLYFLSENTAVNITSASSTVALIVCANPVLTAIVSRLVWRGEKLGNRFAIGSAIALVGTSLVVFNGIFVLDDNPLVFLLSAVSALCWSVYSIVLRVVEQRYSSLEITRKVFFWGVVTMLPYFLYEAFDVDIAMLTSSEVVFNILFLSLGASLGCYLIWNIVLRRIGIVVASNYLYFNPVVALITAHIVLDETITLYAVIGCAITILGVYLCNKKNKN